MHRIVIFSIFINLVATLPSIFGNNRINTLDNGHINGKVEKDCCNNFHKDDSIKNKFNKCPPGVKTLFQLTHNCLESSEFESEEDERYKPITKHKHSPCCYNNTVENSQPLFEPVYPLLERREHKFLFFVFAKKPEKSQQIEEILTTTSTEKPKPQENLVEQRKENLEKSFKEDSFSFVLNNKPDSLVSNEKETKGLTDEEQRAKEINYLRFLPGPVLDIFKRAV